MRIAATRLGENPALAGLKHCNRLEQVLARREWDDPGITEALMLQQLRGTHFGHHDQRVPRRGFRRLLTPRLDRCGVAGIMREVVLEEAAAAGIGATECRLEAAELTRAEEVFLTNALDRHSAGARACGREPGSRARDPAVAGATCGAPGRRGALRQRRRCLRREVKRPGLPGKDGRAGRGYSLLGVLAALILAAAACVSGFFWLRGQYLSAGPAAAASRIEVGPGASLRSVLARLEADGSIRNARAVEWYLRLRAQQPRVQAGTYEIDPHASPAQIIALFEQGRVILEQLTVVEGATFADFLAALDQHPHVAHTLGGKSPAEIMAALGHPGQAPEGEFFPDTYRFAANTADAAILGARLRQHAAAARGRMGSAPPRAAAGYAVPGADSRLDGGKGGGARRASAPASRACSSTACAYGCGCSPIRQ